MCLLGMRAHCKKRLHFRQWAVCVLFRRPGNVGSLGKIYVHFTENVADFPQEVSRESAVEKKYDPNLFRKNRFKKVNSITSSVKMGPI